MCARTGYTHPCETKGCEGIVTCRDLPQYCQNCWASFAADDED